ncbi:PREDICTED: uncharacterized protein LOC108370609 isoform X1 [Rhagoletis zephyria]|uniref:uncharacterized protein LOC108370609 isoform X1 n=1 Tax=Rhagoletis zephyria TaxID=28612 RepID=UPI00081140A0|nr:PREDICTED: uncharacterized protein LOC108370609 isoform X1 [Rhagoletis zephyria]
MNSIMLSDHIQRFYGIREVTLHCRMFKSHTEISVLIYTAVDRKLKRFLSLMFNEKIPPIAYLSLEPSSSIKLKIVCALPLSSNSINDCEQNTKGTSNIYKFIKISTN